MVLPYTEVSSLKEGLLKTIIFLIVLVSVTSVLKTKLFNILSDSPFSGNKTLDSVLNLNDIFLLSHFLCHIKIC